ncbi:hypothetical protein L1987_32836 [Smallanthus sonchifolius]|uniref:Uncharacterized protein n=1 Tax=Smallanthus sonchifolius TaxID=185202 RepID=A0ACB9HQ71_9ASTR|nr:hypothetical protein L1987_32836 [Smallanthus sonchifolius]
MDESTAPEVASILNANVVTSETIKPITLKNPGYIDTRVDELFRSRKNNLRLKMQTGKENVKENITVDNTDCLKRSFPVKLAADKQPQCSGPNHTHGSTSTTQSHITNKMCSITTFRRVVELSTSGEKSYGFSLDMDEAFKALAAPNILISPIESFNGKTNSTSAIFFSEFNISSHKCHWISH